MKHTFPILVMFVLSLSACAAPPSAPSPTASLPSATVPPSPTPSPTATEPPTPTPSPTDSPTSTPFTAIPPLAPDASDPFELDLRGMDLSYLDMRHSGAVLSYALFDNRTIWPPSDRMPPDFDPERILELGRNPGLGVRSLHAQGITGRGVSIAIIDQPLLVDHQEYADRVRLYRETDGLDKLQESPALHGTAVASLAAGKTIGVAPEADLYYFAVAYHYDPEPDFARLAAVIREVLEVNEQLPPENKIRAIAVQRGWMGPEKGLTELRQAIKEASEANMFVITSSLEQTHGFDFQGLGRPFLADPDVFESYEPGIFWARDFYGSSTQLLIPMDSRTLAGPDAPDHYNFSAIGGVSWSIPYIAGMYALAVQVDPDITPDQFWSLAMDTGRTIEAKRPQSNQSFNMGPILDPVALIEALQND